MVAHNVRIEVATRHWRFLATASKSRFVVMYGGASSAKSWSMAAHIVKLFFSQSGIGILVLRKTRPAVRKSCYRLIKHWLSVWGVPYRENKSEMMIHAPNGSFIQFDGLDDVEKLKSIEGINYVWMEEATEFNYHDFLQLHIRCRAHNFHQRNQIFLTFNPVDPLSNKWLKDLTDQRPACTFLNAPCQILHCTHTDNLFLSEDEHVAIEALADADEEYNKIYRLGEWAIPTQIIFTNWNVVDEVPLVDDYAYGLDFGYIHPTVLVWVGINEHDVYLREIIYQTHTTNAELIDLMKEEKVGREDTIMADSAEPAYIQEIADAGFNVHPVVKAGGQGDKSFVRTGIDRMKRLKLHITADSPNLKSEFETYKWKVRKDGEVLSEPVKFHDDGVDACRYVIGSLPEDAEVIVVGDYEY